MAAVNLKRTAIAQLSGAGCDEVLHIDAPYSA
jgi:hypothetical protein